MTETSSAPVLNVKRGRAALISHGDNPKLLVLYCDDGGQVIITLGDCSPKLAALRDSLENSHMPTIEEN